MQCPHQKKGLCTPPVVPSLLLLLSFLLLLLPHLPSTSAIKLFAWGGHQRQELPPALSPYLQEQEEAVQVHDHHCDGRSKRGRSRDDTGNRDANCRNKEFRGKTQTKTRTLAHVTCPYCLSATDDFFLYTPPSHSGASVPGTGAAPRGGPSLIGRGEGKEDYTAGEMQWPAVSTLPTSMSAGELARRLYKDKPWVTRGRGEGGGEAQEESWR